MALAVAGVVIAAVAAHAAGSPATVQASAGPVVVEQGRTVSFSLVVRASGNIRCAATQTNPATATFDAGFMISDGGLVGVTGHTETAKFYGGMPSGSDCQVAWDGEPNPILLPMTVRAGAGTPPGRYGWGLRASVWTPTGPGPALDRGSRIVLWFDVVEGSDSEPPDVSCAGPQDPQHGKNGWLVAPAAWRCTASDGGSGLADPSDATFDLVTAGQGSVMTPSRTVADQAGNERTAGPFGPVWVDLEDPEVHITTPADGARFVLGSEHTALFACVDHASGPASCASNDGIDTSSIGAKSFTATAYDVAGRRSVVTHTYHVVYDLADLRWSGPSHPKAGSALALSWTLNGVSYLGSLSSMDQVPCEGGESGPAESPGRSDVRYVAAADEFRWVWKTQGDWSGSCRTLRLHLADGTSHSVNVSFR